MGLLAAISFGFILGIIVQRSRFCFTAAFRDAYLFKIYRNLKFTLIMVAIITFFYTLFLTLGLVEPYPLPAGWFSIFGGYLFGVGMVLAGGCFLSNTFRIGEGSVNAIIVWIFILAGLALGPVFRSFISFGKPFSAIWLNDVVGTSPIVIGTIQAGILLLLYYRLEKLE